MMQIFKYSWREWCESWREILCPEDVPQSESGSSDVLDIISLSRTEYLDTGVFLQAEKDDFLLEASKKGLMKNVKFWLEIGAKINATEYYEEIRYHCPLHAACKAGHLEIVTVLLKHDRTSVTAANWKKWRPMHFACMQGYIKIVELLLEYDYGTTVLFSRDIHWQTPLHVAIANGHISVAELLSKRMGSNDPVYISHVLNQPDKFMNLPLHDASQNGDVEMVKFLMANTLDKVTSVNTKNEDGYTPCDIAPMRNKAVQNEMIPYTTEWIDYMRRYHDLIRYDEALLVKEFRLARKNT